MSRQYLAWKKARRKAIGEKTVQNLPALYQHNFVEFEACYDHKAFVKELQSVSTAFGWHTRQPNSSWHAIPLRSLGGETSAKHVTHSQKHRTANCDQFKNTRLMRDHCPQIALWLQQQFGDKIYKVRLMKMDAHSTLAAHRDTFPTPDVCRLHIALETNEKCKMTIENCTQVLTTNSVWFTNVRRQHLVINASQTDRVHLVFDVEYDTPFFKQTKNNKIVD